MQKRTYDEFTARAKNRAQGDLCLAGLAILIAIATTFFVASLSGAF